MALRVTDTGTGMTPEVQPGWFEPFFTTKELGKGTGFGLATVEGIVTLSGGSINVYSELRRGTSFKMYFPTAGQGAEVVVDARAEVSPPPARSPTVLVVEDTPGVRDLTRRLLERQGFTVLVAADADEGHAAVQAAPVAGRRGADRCRDGRRQRAGVDQPTRRAACGAQSDLYVGYKEDAIVCRGVLNPGLDFLQKPLTAEILGRKIGEVLGP